MAETFRITGAKELQRKLAMIAGDVHDQLKPAMRQKAEEIMADSKRNYVPVDLGTLRASGRVHPPQVGLGGSIEVEMSYGGAASAYALAVHEHPSDHDPPSWAGGARIGHSITSSKRGKRAGHKAGPKYLEKPLHAAAKNLARDLASMIDVKD